MSVNRYSAGLLSPSSVPAGAVYAEMLAGASKSISIKEIRVVSATNIGANVGISRAFAIGTGAATGIATGIAHRTVGGASGAEGCLQAAWVSSGITPTGFVSKLRQETLEVGTGAVLSLWRESHDGPLVLEPRQSLLLVNHGSGIHGGALFVNVTWEEGPR